MTSNILPNKRTADIFVRQIDGEMVVYDARSHQGLCLNDPMRVIWENLDGKNTPAGIAKRLNQSGYENIEESFVVDAVESLQIHGLVDNFESIQEARPDSDRRTAIKKVLGLGSVMAAPTISVFAIPSAFAQASCIPQGGGPCTNDSDCCSCNCNPQGTCVGNC